MDGLVLLPAGEGLLSLALHLVRHKRQTIRPLPRDTLDVAVLNAAIVVSREVVDIALGELNDPFFLWNLRDLTNPQRGVLLAHDSDPSALPAETDDIRLLNTSPLLGESSSVTPCDAADVAAGAAADDDDDDCDGDGNGDSAGGGA